MHTNEYVKSPLNYIGGKYKLLPQLISIFPNNINAFVDLFGGGFNVGVNVNAKKIVYNDNIPLLVELMKLFYTNSINDIVNRIKENIEKYDLSKENQASYIDFRKQFNSSQYKEPLDFYTLILFSFNYQIRFNNKMEYNNTFGKNRSGFNTSIEKNLKAFIEKMQLKEVYFYNEDFLNLDIKLSNGDFVYCDPPYLITNGSYNDGKRGFKGWTDKEEKQLIHYLEGLNKANIKFALSNVLSAKNTENKVLKEWSSNYNIHKLNFNYNNSNYQRKNSNDTEEVIITNY